MIARRRFGDVIDRQLALFADQHADLLRACDEALRAYDASGREQAAERYERFGDLQAEANDALRDLRDGYAGTLDEQSAGRYRAEFERTAARRLRHVWVSEEALDDRR